ncbi:MAG: RNA methyltransferase [Candidatus Promineifilaceae bacterium]|nr:RNA methyltransferase [Candidatus Promineifilaceae bacterium]
MITSLANSRVKQVRRLQTDRRYREREGAFVIEGSRWLSELPSLPYLPKAVFYTEAWQRRPEHAAILQDLGAVAQIVSESVMEAMSDTESPSGVLAVLPMKTKPLPTQPTLLLILDQIRDPGNLGTMLRTAAAAGVEGILLSPGCVDPYNPKVVRSAMGAHLRLPLLQVNWTEISERSDGLSVWLAAADGALPYTDVNWRTPSALIIGSEAHGAGDEASTLAGGTTYIPMYAETESLNAAMAAGIMLFEAVRQRR